MLMELKTRKRLRSVPNCQRYLHSFLVAPSETLAARAEAEEQVFRYRLQLRPASGFQSQLDIVRG
jgi:hypothetical protein